MISMMKMKKIDEMAMGRIKIHLEYLGVRLTDEQFESLTYREIKKIYRKAEQASALRADINKIVNKPEEKEKKK